MAIVAVHVVILAGWWKKLPGDVKVPAEDRNCPCRLWGTYAWKWVGTFAALL